MSDQRAILQAGDNRSGFVNPVAELDGLPSDAFDSSPANVGQSQRSLLASCRQPLRLSGQSSFRQTTLFGDTLQDAPTQPPSSSRVYRGDLPPETPTHHKLDQEQLKTWVYPTNLGPIRDYQFNIVKNGLFHNTLVALPTGLGKTFIAATVILNFYRWTKDAKMIFVAPTKPLVSQQVEACFTIAGIPRSETTLLTGDTAPALRAAEWASKRLFFMTPQTLQNDLSKGYADPKSIVLIVIDEAHRATGDYAYVKVIGFIRRFTKSFRVLALTATPGSTVEGVQDVINNLGVSHVEIRTEDSLDIRQYVHGREVERFTLDPSVEIKFVQERLSKALKPFCEKLDQQRIWYGRDPMSLTMFGLLKARQEWVAGPAMHLNQGTKFMIMAVFAVLQSVAHAIKLLNFHGIKPFHDSMAEFRTTTEKDEKGSKYRKQLVRDPDFQELMLTVERWLQEDSFESHPKIGFLKERLNTHFQDNIGSNTRAIVFSEYRDSAEEIVRTLNRCSPNIKAAIFVGQADSKRSTGMKQKQQIEAIEKFKAGAFNVLVATSIGEEGLDIGQVDLIICYDASSSPIRMLQRMGRTGRKRAGHVILLLMRGKEEEKFAEAQNNYTHIQKLISDGSQFEFRFDMSERILPRDAKPEVERRFVEIPVENTQDVSLPEPRKGGAARAKKAPKKKFHMPDNVETGFVKASAVLGVPKKHNPVETDFLADIPDLAVVIAKCSANRAFQSRNRFEQEEVNVGTAQFEFLQDLRPTKRLRHGQYTRRNVQLMGRMAGQAYSQPAKKSRKYMQIPVPAFAASSDASEEPEPEKVRPSTMLAEPLAKRRRIAAPVTKTTQRQRVVAYGTPAEEDQKDAEEEDTARRPRKSFKPAVKGVTKQRSSQWQSYGTLDKKIEEDAEDDEKERRPRKSLKPAVKGLTKQRSSQWVTYGAVNEEAKEDAEEEEEERRPRKSSKPAVKGSTRQRSSQWQAYNFSGSNSKPPPPPPPPPRATVRRQAHIFSDDEEEEGGAQEEQKQEQDDDEGEGEERQEEEEEKEEEDNEQELQEEDEKAEDEDELDERLEAQKTQEKLEVRALEKETKEVLDEEMEIFQIQPVRTRGGRGGARGGRGGRGRGAANVSYGRLEEKGDDCMRTSDNYESDGSDSGGDLVDFIADDDEVEEATSSLRGIFDDDDDDVDDNESFGKSKSKEPKKRRTGPFLSSSMTSSPPLRTVDELDSEDEAASRTKKKPNSSGDGRFYMPMRLSQTLESDNIDEDGAATVFGEKARPQGRRRPETLRKPEDDDDDDDESGIFTRRPLGAQRSRRLMDDSDSDD